MSSPLAIITWSMGVQLGTVSLIAAFFLVLSRSVRRHEVRVWGLAWSAEAVATASSLVVVVLRGPVDGLAELELLSGARLALIGYLCGKTAFALLLVRGVRIHFHPTGTRRIERWQLVSMILGWGVILGVLTPNPLFVLPLQWLLVAVVLLLGALYARRQSAVGRTRWLARMMLAQGFLFLTYVPLLAPLLWGAQPLSRVFTFSSLFDAATDLLVAMAILVALESSRAANLRQLIGELESSQAAMRRLVDLDPLTGLNNRRGLRRVVDELEGAGAALIFLDVDHFKAINDAYGHAAGDACLARVAQVLSESFRPQDALFRWGGDEFLILAPGLDAEAASERIDELRHALVEPDGKAPSCTVSVGMTRLAPGAEVTEVIREADERMYGEKHSRY